jgi:hypothetical protein
MDSIVFHLRLRRRAKYSAVNDNDVHFSRYDLISDDNF